MAKEKIKAPAFDDIVFEHRNKEYGAYSLRKKYKRNVIIALLIGVALMSTVIITPYLNAKQQRAEQRKQKGRLRSRWKTSTSQMKLLLLLLPATSSAGCRSTGKICTSGSC
jgi:hypothetical protein